ncbi:hypothetical protein GYMLUDRAFT_253356 [Collybiopsis luxurians FD-317 M1]|uniref:Uncharacterized protein n=1 Tax=Collybiopsis luxurians FD-317 M1 TaxID=944289 RepID=A0A0D0BWY8_9AGAR|nr:hypothetical protein GYMLUDRAFT_253356 [Collybiopsis luxurians FD-317 M1]
MGFSEAWIGEAARGWEMRRCKDDSHFNYDAFYSEIVDFFESDPKDECVTDVLEHWNEITFKNPRGRDATSAEQVDESGQDPESTKSTSELIQEAQEARKAERLAKAAAAKAKAPH